MSGTHSILSPSGAHRWSICAAAPAAGKGVPNRSGRDAALGTAKHEISAACLIEGSTADYHLGSTVTADAFEFIVDEPFVEQVNAYVSAIRREPGEMHVEIRLDTSPILGVAGQGGTADVVMLDTDSKTLGVHDAKFGYNIVYCEGNEQLLLYAAAALHRYDLMGDWEHVKVAIHQPSIGHYDEYTYTRGYVEAFAATLKMPALRAYKLFESGTPSTIRAAMVPGEKQCKWCLVRGSCPARAEAAATLFPNGAEEPATVLLQDGEIAVALTHCDELEGWCKDIRAEAHRRALLGHTIDGFKVVQQKRGARFWVDVVKAEMLLLERIGDKAYSPREVVSPTAAEKLFKALGFGYETVEHNVSQKDGAYTLVPLSDKREPVSVTPMEFPKGEELL